MLGALRASLQRARNAVVQAAPRGAAAAPAVPAAEVPGTGEPLECPLCLTEIEPGEIFYFADCAHIVCSACAKVYLQDQLVRCPHRGCAAEVAPIDWQIAGFDTDEVSARMLPGALTRTGFVPCIGADCPNGVFRLEGDPVRFSCTHCRTVSCVTCRVPWHTGRTCDAYRAEREQAARAEEGLDELLRSGQLRLCPFCGAPCERRGGGCNHVRCRSCGSDFMWQDNPKTQATAALAYQATGRTWREYLRMAVVSAMGFLCARAAKYTWSPGWPGWCPLFLAGEACMLFAEARVRGAGLTPRTLLTAHGVLLPVLAAVYMVPHGVVLGVAGTCRWLGVPLLPAALELADTAALWLLSLVAMQWGVTHLGTALKSISKSFIWPAERQARARRPSVRTGAPVAS